MSTTQTTVPAAVTQSLTPLASPAVYRMTVDEFERIADSLNDDHVELIDGYIVGREEMKPAHVLITERLSRRLSPMLPVDWFVRDDKPVRIPDFDEPRPDVSVVRGDPEIYAAHHPGPADIALLVEVSGASLPRDRGEKRVSYARALIPVYWIVNLVDRQVEVYAGPGPDGYASRVDYRSGQHVPVVINGTVVGQIAVDDLLP